MDSRKSRTTQANNTTYSALVPGQHVVLVDDSWRPRRSTRGNRWPVRGVVYTVREAFVDPYGRVAIRLAEIVNPVLHYSVNKRSVGYLELGFVARRFRPLPRLKVEDFLSTNAPREVKTA